MKARPGNAGLGALLCFCAAALIFGAAFTAAAEAQSRGFIPTSFSETITPGFLPVASTGCPVGTTGIYPDCRRTRIIEGCPPGTVSVAGRCRAPEVLRPCPAGAVGVYPDCRPVVRTLCPSGTAGVYPNCRPEVRRPPRLSLPQGRPEVRTPYIGQ